LVLTRVALYENERVDLVDLKSIEAYAQTDVHYLLRGVYSPTSYILGGFRLSNYSDLFAASTPVKIKASDAALFHPEAATQARGFYVSAGNEDDIEVALSASATNYLELDLSTETGAPEARVFVNPQGSSGAGEEYEDVVDAAIYLKLSITVNTSGFTSGKIPLYKIVTNSSGVATSITDCRRLLFRLGTGGTTPDPDAVFTWPSDPTASDARAENPSTSTSSAAADVPYAGGDKNIVNFKQWMDAVMSILKELGGGTYWYSDIDTSIAGVLRQLNTVVVGNTSGAKWSWSGSALSITDSSGSPSSSDNVAKVRRLGTSQDLNLRRQDGTASTSTIAIADGEVLYITLPASGNQNYSGVGSGAANYKIATRAAFTQNELNYWIAYREGARLYVRGGIELEANESSEIGDTVPITLLNNIGLASEIAAPSYSSDIRGTAAQSIVARVGALTDALGDYQEDRSAILRSATALTWSGTQVSFSSDIVLDVINTKNGTANTYTVSTAGSPIALSDGQVAYISVTRGSSGTASVTVGAATPAQTQANKDVFVLFKRVGSVLLVPFNKQVYTSGQIEYLGGSTLGSIQGLGPDDSIVFDDSTNILSFNADSGSGNMLLSAAKYIANRSSTATLADIASTATTSINTPGVLVATTYTSGHYMPGITWHTTNESATVPKAAVFESHSGSSGSSVLIGVTNTFASGLNNFHIFTARGLEVNRTAATVIYDQYVSLLLSPPPSATYNQLRVASATSGSDSTRADIWIATTSATCGAGVYFDDSATGEAWYAGKSTTAGLFAIGYAANATESSRRAAANFTNARLLMNSNGVTALGDQPAIDTNYVLSLRPTSGSDGAIKLVSGNANATLAIVAPNTGSSYINAVDGSGLRILDAGSYVATFNHDTVRAFMSVGTNSAGSEISQIGHFHNPSGICRVRLSNNTTGTTGGGYLQMGTADLELRNEQSSGEIHMVIDDTDGTPTIAGEFISSASGKASLAIPFPRTASVSAIGFISGSNEIAISTSSRRFKEDIEDYTDIRSERIYDLQPVRFWYKGAQEKEKAPYQPKCVGLIAEEVYKVLPEIVHLDADMKPYTVKYDLLTLYLLEEVKKLRELVK